MITGMLMLGYIMDPNVTSLMGMALTIVYGFIQFGPVKSLDGEDTGVLFHIAGLCLPLWLDGSFLVAFCGFSSFAWDTLAKKIIGRQWSFFNRKFPESEKRMVNVAFSYVFQVKFLAPLGFAGCFINVFSVFFYFFQNLMVWVLGKLGFFCEIESSTLFYTITMLSITGTLHSDDNIMPLLNYCFLSLIF